MWHWEHKIVSSIFFQIAASECFGRWAYYEFWQWYFIQLVFINMVFYTIAVTYLEYNRISFWYLHVLTVVFYTFKASEWYWYLDFHVLMTVICGFCLFLFELFLGNILVSECLINYWHCCFFQISASFLSKCICIIHVYMHLYRVIHLLKNWWCFV